MIWLLACTASSPREGIVSLHDTTTEMVVLLGQEGKLRAVAEPHYLSPQALAAVQSVPRLPAGPVSSEAILAFSPELVLGTDVVSERQPGLAPELQSLGLETRFVDPAGLEGLWQSTYDLGVRLGVPDRADAWIKAQKQQLHKPPAGAPLRVFFYDCCDAPFTAGGRAPLSEMLRTLGAANIFEDQDQDWLTVNWEAVAERQPELIVIHAYDWGSQAGVAEKRARLESNPLMAQTPALQRGEVVVLPLALSLEGPRTLEIPAALGPAIAAARERR